MTLKHSLNTKRVELEQHQRAFAQHWLTCSGFQKAIGMGVITVTGLAGVLALSKSVKVLRLRSISTHSLFSASRILLGWVQAGNGETKPF